MMSFADAIIEENISLIAALIQQGVDVNQIDEYGFTPLVQAAIMDSVDIAKLLIGAGADVNLQDMAGSTPLLWAAENNNLPLARLLLTHDADPNIVNLSGRSPLVMPTLRQHKTLKTLLIKYGASEGFAQDFINTKLLGHMFELVGTANLIDPNNEFVEVDFEGFFLEFSVGLIADALAQFKNHFAAKQMRRFAAVADFIVAVLQRAAALMKYQHYRTNVAEYQLEIDALIQQEPLIMPIGYEGHAITLIKWGHILVQCDRREDSRLYDNIMFYQIGQLENFNNAFIKSLLYERQTDEFINTELHARLDLQPITELKVEAQVSGNCSWANVEACIPSLFFLKLLQHDNHPDQMHHYKNVALNFFHRWRAWGKERALHICIRSFHEGDAIRKACKAEILAAILFQTCDYQKPEDQEKIELILSILTLPRYEYILKNYMKVYCFESHSEQGQRFYKLLKWYGYVNK